MIQLIAGPLGSGKSYFAVNYLCKFCKYDEIYNEYVLDSNVLVISNIEDLKIKHWTLEHCLKDKTHEEFFSIENFEKLQKATGKNHVIIVIDECHLIFPSDYKSNEVYAFFAYSRHLGLDIILLTQGLQSTSRMFNPLLEYVVNVVPRSRQFLNTLSFSYTDLRGKFLYSKSLPKRKMVFNAYSSFRSDEKSKPKNALLHWMLVVVVLLVIAGGLFKTALASLAAKSKPKTAAPVVSSVVLVKPVMSNNSGLRSLPLPVVPFVAQWRVYNVEAYIRDGGRYFYMVGGSFLDSVKCRNYDSRLKTVEYFSVDRLPDGGAISRQKESVSYAGSPDAYQAKTEPLGEVTGGLPDWHRPPAPEYVPVTNLGRAGMK